MLICRGKYVLTRKRDAAQIPFFINIMRKSCQWTFLRLSFSTQSEVINGGGGTIGVLVGVKVHSGLKNETIKIANVIRSFHTKLFLRVRKSTLQILLGRFAARVSWNLTAQNLHPLVIRLQVLFLLTLAVHLTTSIQLASDTGKVELRPPEHT